MADRSNGRELRDLVADAVQSTTLGDDAADISRSLGRQYRARLRDAEALSIAARPAVRRARDDAASRLDPLIRRASPLIRRAQPLVAAGVLPLVAQARPLAARARPLVRQLEPILRRPGLLLDRAAPLVRGGGLALRDAGASASTRVGTFTRSRPGRVAPLAGSPAGRATMVGAAAGAAGAVLMAVALRVAAGRAEDSWQSPETARWDPSSAGAAGSAAARFETAGETPSVPPPARAAASQTPGFQPAAPRPPAWAGPAPRTSGPPALLRLGSGLALGAAFGAVHVRLPSQLRAPLPTVGAALVFATALGALSHAPGVPALGRSSRGLAATIGAHWIFGAALGAGVAAFGSERR